MRKYRGYSVVARRTSTVDQEEKPMSMAERMSMFEGGNSGAGGGGGSFGKGANRNSWRDKNKSSPQAKLADEEKDTIASPVTKRQHKTSQKARDNRHSSPANMYSPKQVKNAAPAPTPAAEAAPAQPTAAARGKSKLRTAFSGMKAAMETEKEHKGISGGGGGGGGFMGLINQVAPKNPVKRAQSVAAPGSAQSKKQALLHWCKRMTEGKAHVDIKNFSSSWNNGMAFCALFHHFIPDQIPYDTLDPKNREYNFRLAFTEGEKAGVTALLDVEDMVDMKNPEWMSVMTYVSLIYNHFNGIRVGGPRLPPMPGQE